MLKKGIGSEPVSCQAPTSPILAANFCLPNSFNSLIMSSWASQLDEDQLRVFDYSGVFTPDRLARAREPRPDSRPFFELTPLTSLRYVGFAAPMTTNAVLQLPSQQKKSFFLCISQYWTKKYTLISMQ